MRWEYRLYYPDNPVMQPARAGDYLVLARRARRQTRRDRQPRHIQRADPAQVGLRP